MNLFEAIEKRASYRREFLPENIPESDIRQIISAGLHAPSGYNYQTTSFVVVQSSELKKGISDLLPTPATRTAPVILVVLSERKRNEAPGAAHFYFDTEDYAAAVENILLAITAKGYAGVWMDGMTRMGDHIRRITELLNIPEKYTVRSILPFGVPAYEIKQKEKLPFDQRVVWEHF